MTPADKTEVPQWHATPEFDLVQRIIHALGVSGACSFSDRLHAAYIVKKWAARHAPKDSWQPISTAVDDLNRRNQLKADLFDYLVWLQDRCPFRDAALEGKLGDYLVCASDGTTCWGKTYQEAVMVARKHDMGLQDAAAPAGKQEGAGTL